MFFLKSLNNTKVIVGSGGTKQKGFISTDIDTLDIRKDSDWNKNFKKESLNIVLAEHVFEHLSNNEVLSTLKIIYKYLKPGGFIRIAIPDKNRKDKKYLKAVRPPIDGHKSFFNISELTKILSKAKFKVCPLEYHDEFGKFHHNPWNPRDGNIKRSSRNDNQKNFWNGANYYTSLIVDAVKSIS